METDAYRSPWSCRLVPLFLVAAAGITPSSHATQLVTSPASAANDYFGSAVGISGSTVIVGAYGANRNAVDSGVAYLYGNLPATSGTITQGATLQAATGVTSGYLGRSVALDGNVALAGASGNNKVYVYHNIQDASGTLTESAVLAPSDAAANDQFGISLAASGNTALVGAPGPSSGSTVNGAAYLYRNLGSITGERTEDLKLVASDGAANDRFGISVALHGTTAAVGASWQDDKGTNSGSVYIYRGVHEGTGTRNEDLKLLASDGAANDELGAAVSLADNKVLAGARLADIGGNANQGAAYLFTGIASATGTLYQTAKLLATDGAANDQLGNAVALGESGALVAASFHDSQKGAVYLYQNLDGASGNVYESVKIVASDASAGAQFGSHVALDGDFFVIGSRGFNNSAGKAYFGSISSITTLDEGNTSRIISGISFTSREEWIIGRTTSGNSVTLGQGDKAHLPGKAVYVGREAGSNLNTLILHGELAAATLHIGSAAGNYGNAVRFGEETAFTLDAIYLAGQNRLEIEGDRSDAAAFFAWLGDTELHVWWENAWQLVDAATFTTYLNVHFEDNLTTLQVIPEPSVWSLLLAAGYFGFRRRRFRPQ